MTAERRTGPVALALILLGGLAGCGEAVPTLPEGREAELAARSAGLANAFQQELQVALKSAIAAGGHVGAIDTCASVAPAIAERLSEESGATVRRTALKARNPVAKPDAFERETMSAWIRGPVDAEGRPVVRAAVVRAATGQAGGGGAEYRWMRAIPAQPMCLACHGKAIAPDVQKAIDARYPEDKAIDFEAGDLRGAFSIRWTGDAVTAGVIPAA